MSRTHLHDQPVAAGSYVKPTADCRPEDVGEVGGKAVGLGSLLRAGLPVPASFVVTAAAYRRYVADGAGTPAPWLADPIASAYAELCRQQGAIVPVAVRSSATLEDSADASCAGQYRTFLGARGAEQVVEEVARCWLSSFDPHVDAYHAERAGGPGFGDVAVVVQELVDAQSAGVMFTQHPLSGDRSLVVIEASFGLGEAVVGGEVVPDLFEVNKITRQIVRRVRGAKPHEHRLHEDGDRVERRPLDEGRAAEWSITDEQVAALTAMAAELEKSLGRGLDVEWAHGTVHGTVGGKLLFTLQVRPITVDPSRAGPTGTERSRDVKAASSVPGRVAPAESAIDAILGRLSGHAAGGEPS